MRKDCISLHKRQIKDYAIFSNRTQITDKLLNIDRNRGNSFESHVVPEVYQREVRILRVESPQNFLECSVPAQEHQASLTG